MARARAVERFGELAGDKSLVSVKLDGGQIGLQN